MKRLKIKLFMQRNRKIINILGGMVGIGLIIFCINEIEVERISNNPTVFSVVGTLLGALIGGMFSLIGSIWVNSKQQRAQQNIKRKNVIYSPLYDELIENQNNILKCNPYPDYIRFEKGSQTIVPHPQYSAWGRIKADIRYLETPEILVKQMEKLYKAIDEYISIRCKANEEIKDIFNSVLIDNGLEKCSIINIGDVISGDVLENANTDIYHRAMEITEENTLDKEMRKKINNQVYELANSNQVILDVRKRYETWINMQIQTIELLGIMIKQVILQYEG